MKRAPLHQQTYVELRTRAQQAFRGLRKTGFTCRSNFSCCQGCGRSELGNGPLVFWHKQDTESAQNTGVLYLAWAGNGETISKALKEQGLKVVWNGKSDQRIAIKLPPERQQVSA